MTQQPDLILMDINIRGSHDGIELADIIHKSNPIPVIFITSLKDDETLNRANQTQPISFLIKPFNQTQLQRIIEITVRKLSEGKTGNSKNEEWENDFLFQEHFYVKTRQKLEKIAIENVLYLESDKHHVWVYSI